MQITAWRYAGQLKCDIMQMPHHALCDAYCQDFLRFADYFFDGAIADWMVQSKIRQGRRQLQQAIARVEEIRRQLWAMLK